MQQKSNYRPEKKSQSKYALNFSYRSWNKKFIEIKNDI